jgi:hypothetical protein
MKYTKPMRLLPAFSLVLVFTAAFCTQSVAQTPTPTPAQPAPEFLALTSVSVKPEMMGDFQNFMKNTTNPALKKGGVKWRDVWQNTTAAGDAFEYVMVAPIGKFAEYDGPSALEKGLGAQGLPAWQTKASSLVNSVHRSIIRTRPDLGFEGQQTGPPKLAVVTYVHVAPNRNSEFENYLKNDYAPAMKQAGVTYLVAQTIFGGDANEYITLTMRDSFTDLDKGPVLVQALGAEGAQKLLQKLPAGVVAHVERSLIRFVPDLSITSAKP